MAERAYFRMTVPASEEYEVPGAMARVARTRVEHLRIRAFNLTLTDLLANAYMQGMNDAVAALSPAQSQEMKP